MKNLIDFDGPPSRPVAPVAVSQGQPDAISITTLISDDLQIPHISWS